MVEQYLEKECGLGQVVGMLKPDSRIHGSHFEVMQKSHQPDKWRLIVDLSTPKGFHVNNSISLALCLLSHALVDDEVQHIMTYSQGALLANLNIESAKLNIESANWIFSVHLDDRSLLGMMWKGSLYVDTFLLPFRLHSTPKLFVPWWLCCHGF